jgi:bifunctional DNase/RNase
MIEAIVREAYCVEYTDGKPAGNIVVLQAKEGNGCLPIFMESPPARSIAAKIRSEVQPRPRTVGLMMNIISQLDGQVDSAAVTKLEESVYYAVLHVSRDSQTYEFDARPSDAISLVVQAGAPIFIAPDLLLEDEYLQGLLTSSDTRTVKLIVL